MNHTRPDIACAVKRLGRYIHSPNISQWTALERALKYLKGTMDYAIHYIGFPAVLEGYSMPIGSLIYRKPNQLVVMFLH